MASYQDNLPSGDPQDNFLNASCFELLLLELVPLAYRLEAESALRDEEWVQNTTAQVDSDTRDKRITASLGINGIGPALTSTGEPTPTQIMPVTTLKEGVFHRLDQIGYRVGLALAERFSRDKSRFTDPLDVIKFLCKDIWTVLWRKQIDNLKTNHRGIYVLTDNVFAPLKRTSLERARPREQIMAQAQSLLYFPCGVVRGVLSALGIEASVLAETAELPGASFQIRIVGVK